MTAILDQIDLGNKCFTSGHQCIYSTISAISEQKYQMPDTKLPFVIGNVQCWTFKSDNMVSKTLIVDPMVSISIVVL